MNSINSEVKIRLNMGAAIVVAAAALILGGCTDNTVVSEGSRIGVVTKLSHKALCTTSHWGWEGELSMTAGTTASGQGGTAEGTVQVAAWAFSVNPNGDLNRNVEALKAAMDSGHHVKLTYHQIYSADSCVTATDYLVTEVRDLEAK